MANVQDLVVLRNRDRFRLFSATLYHSVICVRGGKCICEKKERPEPEHKGEFFLAERSIVLPPKQESEPIPRLALEVPQIAQALKERWLEDLTALAQVEIVPKRSKRRRKE